MTPPSYSICLERADRGEIAIFLLLPLHRTPESARQHRNWQELSWPADVNSLVLRGDDPVRAANMRAIRRDDTGVDESEVATVAFTRRHGQLFRVHRGGRTTTHDLGRMLEALRRLDALPLEPAP